MITQTLRDLHETRNSVTGFELEQMVNAGLKSDVAEERDIAAELKAVYFTPSAKDDKDFKPLKFVHYRLIRKNGVYILRRNLYMSPRGSVYWDATVKVDDDALRDILLAKQSVTGKELKDAVKAAEERQYCFPVKEDTEATVHQISCRNFSKQLADYINTYFIDTDKPLCDDVYYGITCRECGTATVYRDQKKSPRVNKQPKRK